MMLISIPNAGAIFVQVARSCEVYLLSHTHASTILTNFISGSCDISRDDRLKQLSSTLPEHAHFNKLTQRSGDSSIKQQPLSFSKNWVPSFAQQNVVDDMRFISKTASDRQWQHKTTMIKGWTMCTTTLHPPCFLYCYAHIGQDTLRDLNLHSIS